MKKIRQFFVLIILILLTGCSNYNMTMDIAKDKSMDFTVTILSNNEDEQISKNMAIYKEKLEKYGYIISEYNDNNSDELGLIITKHFDNIDDIALGKRSEEFDLLYFYKNDFNSEIESKIFNVDKGFDTNRYAANFYVDLTNLNIDLDVSMVTFKVFVPNGTISNNANLVSSDGNELTWNITSLGKTEIDFVFELKSYDYIYYGVAVLIAILLFFLIINAFFTKDGDNNTNNQVSNKYDLERKIQNISNNAVNKNNYVGNNNQGNIGSKINRDNNNFNINDSYRDNYISNNSDGYLDMDRNINSKQNDNLFNSNTFNNNNNNFNNRSNNVNSLVPEIEISNLKTPIKEDKKGLLSKLNKKANKKTNKEIIPDVKNEDNFSEMVDNINHGQMGGVGININSQVTPIKNIGYTKDENIENDNFLNNDNNNEDNFDVTNENIVKNNPNLNVNAIPFDISSIDSIAYQEQENYNTSEEENDVDNKIEGPIIKVNSKEIVVDKGKKEE